jgi:type IX secretion system PorP/SprF family membrane protein
VGYRYQWSGLGADAPVFLNASYSFRLKQPIDLTYNAPRTSNSSLVTHNNFPAAKTLIHGLGVSVFHESYKPTTISGGGINYGLHYAVAKKVRLSFGLGVMYEGLATGDGVIYRDPSDPRNGTVSRQSMISARAGFLLYSNFFYMGGSYLPLWKYIIEAPPDDNAVPSAKATAKAGFAFQLTPEVGLKPGALLTLMSNDELVIDYTLKVFIQQRFWLGVTYRDVESTVISAGFDISNSMSVLYSYEVSTGEFKQFSDASHDLVLAFRLNNFKRQKQYTW